MLCGIDEAGRGCVAGSLFMAAAILPSRCLDNLTSLGVKDSKKLSFEARNDIAKRIMEYIELNGGFYKISQSSPSDIDSLGLRECLMRNLQELRDFALCKGSVSIMFDGNTSFGVLDVDTLVKGDSLNLLISSASILAKFYKDKEMLCLHEIDPRYGFKHNKGYLTKMHKQSIREFGYSEFHRKSYKISL
ncbi:ribonuclease HII [Helicobacter muridarum]|uniref:Ribonuclease n=1 Tax=Helicobacter muridarum TaxID=216 RepID=A0A099TZ89_9HELI|nr:ribonuclease HII [Helicobacter muridarum]TLE00482.1 ribonuclease HII [Helicobacter muridarum]STQ86458.1 ribonuclease HII [Helicobacter muridarum]